MTQELVILLYSNNVYEAHLKKNRIIVPQTDVKYGKKLVTVDEYKNDIY